MPASRRNLTHGVLAAMFHKRGRVATDTPEMAAARDQQLAIQRRHRVERRHGEQPSQTPPLDALLRRHQLRNAEDEAPTISQGNSPPVQAAEERDMESDADELQNTTPQPPRAGLCFPDADHRHPRPHPDPVVALADALGYNETLSAALASEASPKKPPRANSTNPAPDSQATTRSRHCRPKTLR